MNKSKFLKKSLAMLLALMLVVAMIPLSASAAPSEKFTPKAANGQSATVEETEDGWHLYYQYTDKPSVAFEVATSGESVAYVNANGETVDYTAGTTVALPTDEDGAPTPLTIKVTNNGETTEHTITWAMANASGTVSVSRAVIGNIEADSIDNENQTIHFTLPFGYVEKNATVTPVVTAVGGTAATMSDIASSVGTNENAADEVTVAVTPQNNSAPVNYTVVVEEEKGLTSIRIGDYEGEFLLKSSDPDKGYETGVVQFTVPVGTSFSDEIAVSYEIGSSFTSAYLGTTSGASFESSNTKISSGDKYDFSGLAGGTPEYLTIVNADGYREYELKIVEDTSDTSITAAYVTLDGDLVQYDAEVDGTSINVTVPANANLGSAVTVAFTGPKATSSDTPKIQPVGGTPAVDPSTNGEFNTSGEASLKFTDGYSSPVRLQLTSGNGDIYGYYTLTITKATTENKNPQVTSAKVVLRPGADNEYTATGAIDQTKNTITFTVPYSTTDAEVATGAATYSFGKTAQTHWTTSSTPTITSLKDGGSIGVTSNDNDNAKEYKIVFERKAAQTGKTISNFQLSTANNENLKAYNNNKNYDVTVSGKEFKVTLPTTQTGDLYPSFELSEGAALYKVAANATAAPTTAVSAFTKVNDYDSANDGAAGTTLAAADYADGVIYNCS